MQQKNQKKNFLMILFPNPAMQCLSEEPAQYRKGRSGIRETTFKVTYVDGKEYSREKIKTETTRTPKDKIVEYGLAIDMSVPENLNYSRVYRGCRAVSYNYSETRYTASGRKCEYGIAAVDTEYFSFQEQNFISPDTAMPLRQTEALHNGTTVDLYFDHRIRVLHGERRALIFMCSNRRDI